MTTNNEKIEQASRQLDIMAAQFRDRCGSSGVELELAAVAGPEGVQAGVGIWIEHQNAPLFMSTAELRSLADLVDGLENDDPEA